MNVYYNVEIQMENNNTITDEIMNWVFAALGRTDRDVDERDEYNATLFFASDIKPSEVMKRVRKCLQYCETIYYIDVIYRYEGEIDADRFVIWRDGKEQEYTGHMIFTEDE